VLEDLDSLIDDENRAFFLNELDGFAANTGVVILATTNHPDKLDPAILDRPSRFDRKYYFNLPSLAERLGFLSFWNQSLEPDLKLSEGALRKLGKATEGFSFAHLKELFLSSMMQWMSEGRVREMGSVMSNRITVLREQMNSSRGKKEEESQEAAASA
jgi:ATP-dependent 26S proteasome regulatory subunit